MKIDNTDRKIILALDFHARDSLPAMARTLRMSPDTLRYRIKRLEEEGVIKGYFAVPDTPKMGLVSYKLMFKYQNMNEEREAQILQHLHQRDEVGWLIKTDGYYDLMVVVWVKDDFEMDHFLSKFLDHFSPYLFLRDFNVITENHACRKAYLSSNPDISHQVASYTDPPRLICDKTDLRLIKLLTSDARRPSVELAKELSLTPEAISYRIKQLQKKGVLLAFRPRIDLTKINRYFYNVLFRLGKTSALPRLFAYARQNPSVSYFARYLGNYDMSMDLEVESPAHFRAIMRDIMKKFGSSIINFNHVLIYEELKITY